MSLKNFLDYLDKNSLEKKPHQIEAVTWCIKRELYGILCNKKIVKGGLIADEMGLGKTIEIIGTIVSNIKKTLIVVPRCLLEQWKKIIIETTDKSILLFHGQKREKDIEIIKNYDIVLTTYNIIALNKKNENILYNIKWERIIFDEAHHMRNSNINIFKGAKKLKSEIRWLLTGTPIQNSKKDFYSLCEQIGLENKYYTNPQNLCIIAKNFILKRTKKEINLDLPNIHNIEIKVDWESNEEKILSKEIHSRLEFSNIKESPLKIGNEFGNTYLPLIMRAKQCCVYPPMLKSKALEIIDKYIIDTDKIELKNILLDGTKNTSKINKVINIIVERKDNNNKKIIFCTFRSEIDYIEERLKKDKIKIKKFDGRTNENERKKILEDKSLDILILQIQTGCEGLNLQHFNEVYFVSSHWNPAIEDQAIARVYRIGQKKDIYIFKFTMNNFDDDEDISLEKYIINVQNDKRELRNIIESN